MPCLCSGNKPNPRQGNPSERRMQGCSSSRNACRRIRCPDSMSTSGFAMWRRPGFIRSLACHKRANAAHVACWASFVSLKEPPSWLLFEQESRSPPTWCAERSSIVTFSRRNPSTAPSSIFPLEYEHSPWDVSSSDFEHGGWSVVCSPAHRHDVLGPVHEGRVGLLLFGEIETCLGRDDVKQWTGPPGRLAGELGSISLPAIPLGDHDALSIAEGSQRRLRRGPDVRSFRHLGWRLQLSQRKRERPNMVEGCLFFPFSSCIHLVNAQ